MCEMLKLFTTKRGFIADTNHTASEPLQEEEYLTSTFSGYEGLEDKGMNGQGLCW